jgi:hypothetical protein
LTTNIFIVAGVVRHWNSNKTRNPSEMLFNNGRQEEAWSVRQYQR